MTDLIQRLTAAIFRQEGMAPTWNNPGNLRDCPWFPIATAVQLEGWGASGRWPDYAPRRAYPDGTLVQRVLLGNSGWFWNPRTYQEGAAGALHDVALHVAEGNNLVQLISIWAPLVDKNNTNQYITNVATWAAIPDIHVPLWTLL